MVTAVDIAGKVDGGRLWERLMHLARFGARPDGGVDRPALSMAEIEARSALIDWGRGIGLAPASDPIGNLFLRLDGEESSLPAVMAGSHIDSQPTGGKFDGTFGVLAALEAVEAIVSAGVQPRRPIEVVAWTNEEGSRFAPGMMGSEAFTGRRPLEQILPVVDRDGISAAEAVQMVLDAHPDIRQEPLGRAVAAFVEPHIEQGPVLERAGIPIGIVTGIQGTRRYRVRVEGEAAHAGTTPRAERKDALMAALRMIGAVDALCARSNDTLCTVGMLTLEPNASSVIPGSAYFSIDVRQRDNAVLNALGTEIPAALEAKQRPCSAAISEIAHAPSITFDETVRGALATAADALKVSAMDIYSAAGHDARQLNHVCPTGMLFVPCRGGLSHNPAEYAEPADLEAGAKVLAHALWELSQR